mmetsp:Transcript_16436/g.33440  ORF Transcript_16436/g.33440 Transcript_16436/m.33440 type:complete len:296 (+) Transcript_16436:1742-2629(+)
MTPTVTHREDHGARSHGRDHGGRVGAHKGGGCNDSRCCHCAHNGRSSDHRGCHQRSRGHGGNKRCSGNHGGVVRVTGVRRREEGGPVGRCACIIDRACHLSDDRLLNDIRLLHDSLGHDGTLDDCALDGRPLHDLAHSDGLLDNGPLDCRGLDNPSLCVDGVGLRVDHSSCGTGNNGHCRAVGNDRCDSGGCHDVSDFSRTGDSGSGDGNGRLEIHVHVQVDVAVGLCCNGGACGTDSQDLSSGQASGVRRLSGGLRLLCLLGRDGSSGSLDLDVSWLCGHGERVLHGGGDGLCI